MKKTLSFIFIVYVMLCFVSCGSGKDAKNEINIQSKPAAAPEADTRVISPEMAAAEEDVKSMLPVLASEAEYFDINAGTLDFSNLSSEDFWNIIAIAVDADPEAQGPDAYGTCHMSFDDIYPYIETLAYKTYNANGLPAITESYSVSKDPWSNKYDVVPLSLNNKKYSVEAFIESSESWFGEEYILKLSLTDDIQADDAEQTENPENTKQTSSVMVSSEAALEMAAVSEKNVWGVCLKYWDDGESHRFPMQVVNIIKVDE